MVPEHLEDTKKLGFGLMRLPHKGVGIDVAQTADMADAFLDAGFTYFDTAYVYVGSEEAIRKALVERHPREDFTLATKLFATAVPTESLARREFETSLKRLGADYVDFYLLHSLMESNYKKYDRFHLWEFVSEQRAKGRIRHVGFSFHGGPVLLDKLLSAHPEVEFVQLQINYLDWESDSVQSRANYEVARKHNVPVVVMEPVKGGKLADPPAEVKALMDAAKPGASYASWAIRFAASLEGVLTVLSGMSTLQQMQDNLSYMADFQPLSAEERRIIHECQRIMGSSAAIPCTTCHYCTAGCPKHIPIPEIFTAFNLQLGEGQLDAAKAEYERVAPAGSRASDCIRCGKCEAVCPQHLKIRDLLAQAADVLE